MQKRGFEIKKEILKRVVNNSDLCIRSISKDTGIAEQHLRRALKSLENKHILKRIKGKGKKLNIVLSEKKKDFIEEVLGSF